MNSRHRTGLVKKKSGVLSWNFIWNNIQIRSYVFLMLAYFCVYIAIFNWLEKRPVYEYHVVHCVLDDMIPFNELFIVPYLLWFLYILVTVSYFIIRVDEKAGYYQLAANLIMGMSIFLIVSYAYPNMLQLRPAVFERENIFTDMVRHLYTIDTPTNVLPSIHVFNSFACHLALSHSPSLRRHKGILTCSFILMLLIVLSTMFLKQHSVVDVILGCTMALFGYLLFYTQQAPSAVENLALVSSASKGQR